MIEVSEKSPNDSDSLAASLITLYDEVNKRSEGVYKRNAKVLSFIVGFLIAVLANADTFNMANNLANDNNSLVNQAVIQLEQTQLKKCSPDKPLEDCFDPDQQNNIKTLIHQNAETLPLGWDYDQTLKLKVAEKDLAETEKNYQVVQQLKEVDSCKVSKDDKDKGQSCFDAVEKLLFAANDKSNSIVLFLSNDFMKKFKEANNDKGEAKLTEFRNYYIKFIADKKSKLVPQLLDLKSKQASITSSENFKNPLEPEQINNIVKKHGGWPKVVVGWLITAIALSMEHLSGLIY